MAYSLRKRLALLLAFVMVASGLFLSNGKTVSATKVQVYDPEAPIPIEQPAAGQKYIDPNFGTEILRVTGTEDGDSNVYYAYYPTFNCDSTKILLSRGGTPTVYDIDPVNLEIISSKPLYDYDGGNYRFWEAVMGEGALWSNTEPDVLYGTWKYNWNPKIVKYNVDTRETTLVRDFTPELGEGYAVQMSKSDDDRYFAFHFIPHVGHDRNLADDKWGVRKAVVYDSVEDKTYIADMADPAFGFDLSVGKTRLDEVRIDKSGRYLAMFVYHQHTGAQVWYIWDFKNQPATESIIVDDDIIERGSQHYDTGFGTMVQGDRWYGNGFNIIKRDLTNPEQWKTILYPYYNMWGVVSHVSLTGPTDEWAMISTYMSENQVASKPFIAEVFMVKTDGSGDVIRLAKTRSKYYDYWDCPFANISYDGRLFAYSSNWGGTRSVYIGRIPEGIWNQTPPEPQVKDAFSIIKA